MGFRFQKRIKLLPGLRANLSLKGASLTAGTRGLHVTRGHGRTTTTVGLPGTGLSHQTVRTDRQAADEPQEVNYSHAAPDLGDNLVARRIGAAVAFVVGLYLLVGHISQWGLSALVTVFIGLVWILFVAHLWKKP